LELCLWGFHASRLRAETVSRTRPDIRRDTLQWGGRTQRGWLGGGFGGLVDFFGRRSGVVGDLSDHFVGVEVELDTFDVTDGGVEGAQDEFGAFEFDGAARQGVGTSAYNLGNI
jgi:hypothetical protein